MGARRHITRAAIAATLLVTSMIAHGQQRTVSEAQTIAQEYMQKRPSRSSRRLAPPRERATALSASHIQAKASAAGAPEAFYVFNYPQSRCFVIVSGDERMPAVLAYSDEQQFDMEHMAPQTRWFLQNYVNMANSLQHTTSDAGAITTTTRRKTGATDIEVPYLLKTEWTQTAPFNLMCPEIDGIHTLTGCVATMMAQIMNFYQYPATGTGYVSYTTRRTGLDVNVDFDTMPFDWTNMRNNYRDGYTDEEAQAVATLMLACGATVGMDYMIQESGASLESVPQAMNSYFGYDRDITIVDSKMIGSSDFEQLLQNEILEGRPVACGASNERGAGHAFVIDGMKADDNEQPFYHVNWGWAGYNDGNYRFVDMEYNQKSKILLYLQPENGKRDCGAFLQATSMTPAMRNVNPNIDNTIPIAIKDLVSSKLGDFDGMLYAYLVDANGTETLVGKTDVSLKEHYMRNYNIPATIPTDLELGVYNIRIVAKESETDSIEGVVYFGSEYDMTITDKTDVAYTPKIQMDAMMVNPLTYNDTTISITLSNLLNLDAKTFQGEIALAIANDNDSILSILGGSYTIDKLAYSYIHSQPVSITSTLTDSLDDGNYRIIAVARQTNYDNWGRIKKYEHTEQFTITKLDIDYYIPINITGGIIKIDDAYVPKSYNSKLSITQLTVNKSETKGRHISIRIDQPVNIDGIVFSGEYSMALIDNDGNIVEVFGNTPKENNLQAFMITLTPKYLTFEGDVPETVEDGEYRICIAARKEGFTNWTPLTSYTIDQNYVITLSKDIPAVGVTIAEGEVSFDIYDVEDVNHDGAIDTQDVLTIYNFMQDSDGDAPTTQDVNQDGVVDTQDVLQVYKYMQDN